MSGIILPRSACCAGANLVKLIPCYEPGTECAECDTAPTPKFWTVTFSNIDLAGCCNFTSGCWEWQQITDFNTSFVLEQTDGNPCIWDKHIVVADTLKEVVGNPLFQDCDWGSLPETDYTIEQWVITFWFDLGTGKMRLWILGIWDGDEPTQIDFWTIFDTGEIDVEIACDETNGPVSNAITERCPGGDGNMYLGDSGTAVLAPGDRVTAAVRCPGGDAFHTDNAAIHALIGSVVTLVEDADPICYLVAEPDPEATSDGDWTLEDSYASCTLCCADA